MSTIIINRAKYDCWLVKLSHSLLPNFLRSLRWSSTFLCHVLLGPATRHLSFIIFLNLWTSHCHLKPSTSSRRGSMENSAIKRRNNIGEKMQHWRTPLFVQTLPRRNMCHFASANAIPIIVISFPKMSFLHMHCLRCQTFVEIDED